MRAAPASGDDARFMARALELARRGWGAVHPNPLVGAVLVRDGSVIGEGWHRGYGQPHAEVEAIADAGDASGATLYVTLEPCAHHGKTPPCTDAILNADLRRVVFAAADPGAEAGGGAARLSAAGVNVEGGVLEDAARAQNAPFFTSIEHERPWVLLKLAVSLDGCIAARAGQRTCLSGKETWADVHRLRAGFDAILIGAGTARTDDPLLTVRGDVAARIPPARVVLDPAASLAPSSRLVSSIGDAPVRVFCTDAAPPQPVAALRAAGATVEIVPGAAAGVSIDAVLDRLWQQGVRAILCEGGGRLAGSLLGTGHVDRLRLYVSPRFLPGGVRAFGGTGAPPPGDRGAWALLGSERLGDDVSLTYDRAGEGGRCSPA